jgi:hypothetical protein
LTPEEVARRHANRPGYTLVSYGEVGLPYYRVQLRVEVLEHKEIGPFPEFVLRGVEAGVDEPDGLGELLGLDERVLEATVVDLLGSDDLFLGRAGEAETTTLALTPKGRRTLETAVAIVPQETLIEIHYDALLQSPEPPLDQYLMPIELKDLGIREIPPARTRPPDLGRLQPQFHQIDAVIRALGARRAAKRDLLALRAVESRKRIFRTAIALVFRAEDDSNVQVAFAIDGKLSERHEEAFAQSKLMRKIGIGTDGLEAAESAIAELLGSDLMTQALGTTAPAIATDEGGPEVDAAGGDAEEVSTAGSVEGMAAVSVPAEPKSDQEESSVARLDLPSVAIVETYDHPGYLQQALTTAQDRILIVSPWIRGAVVNHRFFQQLEARLAAGVDVFIGWGITPLEAGDDRDADSSVLQKFGRLKETYRWNFTYTRLGDTHAKVLICDRSFMIVSSFNWLSFKGDPSRTFRDERGVLVSLPDEIDRQFDSWQTRLLTGSPQQRG